MSTLNKVKKHLRPGQIYRRSDFERWSNSVDRHLKQLQSDGTLRKLSRGLYLRPKKTAFGDAPAKDEKLVQRFLKDDNFLMTSPNAYNALGIGTTQLYNETVVYNHKRHGFFKLGNRVFKFQRKPFPPSLSTEFLLVDLVNNLNQLAEDTNKLLDHVKAKASSMDRRVLSNTARKYGRVRTKKFFDEVLASNSSLDAS
jgi:hypothetical protein